MINPIFYIDFYKVGHVIQYPTDTTQVYSNWTPRSSRVSGQTDVVNLGFTYFAKDYIGRRFTQGFFDMPWDLIEKQYRRVISATLGMANPKTDHIKALHDLGYLPLRFYSLPEGCSSPLNCPQIVVTNTHPDFFWLPNYLETIMSAVLWKPSTSATTAKRYRAIFEKFAREAGETDLSFIDWQGHDFSFRGMSGLEDAILSGIGHLTCFSGTDSIPAIIAAKEFYGADLSCGGSVPATEHSVMCSGTEDGEFDTFKRLLTEIYPTGILSIVSDTWDLWTVLTDYIPRLRDVILSRHGKMVIRPDSGDPVKIMCGDPDSYGAAHQGTLRLLAEALGTDNNRAGLPLISNAGAIYGDSITPERAEQILYRCVHELKLSPFNCVFGIGSYCVDGETPILCSDLVWRKAGELKVGQGIVAFDEDPFFGDKRHAARRYKSAFIVSNAEAVKRASRIETDIGDPIIASDDHPWLVWSNNRTPLTIYTRPGDAPGRPHKKKLPRTAGLIWKTTSQLKPGDKIAFLGKPWVREETRDAGWLAGMYDGEGCIAKCTVKSTRIPSWKVNISQNEGPLLQRVREELSKREFTFYANRRKCPQLCLTGGWYEFLRFLGTIAPSRLISKLPKIMNDLPALSRTRTYQLAEVQSVEEMGDWEVASIETSSGTFITGGYLSHNTYEYVTRDTYGFAMKATAVVRAGKLVPIFKNPKTDNARESKKSRYGIPCVHLVDGKFSVKDNCEPEELDNCAFEKVWEDGTLLVDPSFDTIRQRVRA